MGEGLRPDAPPGADPGPLLRDLRKCQADFAQLRKQRFVGVLMLSHKPSLRSPDRYRGVGSPVVGAAARPA